MKKKWIYDPEIWANDPPLCECGCGNRVGINSRSTKTKRIWNRFYALGCQTRGRSLRKIGPTRRYFASRGYPYIYSELRRTHAPEHVVVAEQALGKLLPKGTDVHHVDENRTNNANTNLVICQDRAYHKLLHRRTSALKACGNPNYRKCATCHQYDDPGNLVPHGHAVQHLECRRSVNNAYYKKYPEKFNKRKWTIPTT